MFHRHTALAFNFLPYTFSSCSCSGSYNSQLKGWRLRPSHSPTLFSNRIRIQILIELRNSRDETVRYGVWIFDAHNLKLLEWTLNWGRSSWGFKIETKLTVYDWLTLFVVLSSCMRLGFVRVFSQLFLLGGSRGKTTLPHLTLSLATEGKKNSPRRNTPTNYVNTG